MNIRLRVIRDGDTESDVMQPVPDGVTLVDVRMEIDALKGTVSLRANFLEENPAKAPGP